MFYSTNDPQLLQLVNFHLRLQLVAMKRNPHYFRLINLSAQGIKVSLMKMTMA